MRGFGNKIFDKSNFFIEHLNKNIYLESLENKLKLSGGRVQDEISETDAFNRFKHISYHFLPTKNYQ